MLSLVNMVFVGIYLYITQVMKVKLQPPSNTELPAFNPILPPAAVTQILLLANPHKVAPFPLSGKNVLSFLEKSPKY